MVKIKNSLAFKIGLIIILIELLVIGTLGIIYINKFFNEVDRRIEENIKFPGSLMNAGLMNFNSIEDDDLMKEMVGEISETDNLAVNAAEDGCGTFGLQIINMQKKK